MSPGRRRTRPGLGQPPPGSERAAVVVPAELDGERLDRALPRLVPSLSRTRARAVIGLGGVFLGQDRCRVAGRKVRAGDRLTATWHPSVSAAPEYELAVLHADRHLIVAAKPAGQLTQGTALGDAGTLLRALEQRFGAPIHLLQRLDAAASGVLVAARDRRGRQHLAPQFAAHDVSRRYLAVTAARPPEGPCELSIGRAGRLRAVDPAGQPARTDLRVIAADAARTLVEATLHTGRTHQIRVHLQALGAPIVGDRDYGGAQASRLCLHAAHLAFRHPDGDREVAYDLSPGEDFWAAAGMSAPAPPGA